MAADDAYRLVTACRQARRGGTGIWSPLILSAAPAKNTNQSAARITSPSVSRTGLPIVAALDLGQAAQHRGATGRPACKHPPRADAVIRAPRSVEGTCGARTAWSTSVASASRDFRPDISSVDGSIDWITRPEWRGRPTRPR